MVVFGTFDIIHPAHLKFLIEVRSAVDCFECELIVVLARDSSIVRIKGHEPIFDEEKRLRLISGLRVVDYALLGNEGENHFQIILDLEPDYIVLGYDQVPNIDPLLEFIKNNKLKTIVHRLPKYESGDLSSSSEVRDKVLELYNSQKKNKERRDNSS
ncbi:MAG: adenylyltransferase/cytidyltransferase family protein [Asgard group archaeon]|nr:adenylyltransferase/cytidyltransferase family protein [Asgard group archaeon]